MQHAPLVGIPCYQEILPPTQRPRFWMYQTYGLAVEAAGMVPVLLPLFDKPLAPTLLERLDGLLLAGGDDVNPARYQQAPHPKTERPDDLRDKVEIAWARAAVETEKPLLAICRGMQVLNVAFGGSLIQHIQDGVPSAVQHEFNYDDYHLRHIATHDVTIVEQTRLASILGTQTGVNSFHHQAVDRIAEGFRVTACAPDGVIEAMEGGAPDQFVVAVQWHPEDMYHEHPNMLRLFEAFAAAIQERAGG
jgi:putative glutamine amidotransferase